MPFTFSIFLPSDDHTTSLNQQNILTVKTYILAPEVVEVEFLLQHRLWKREFVLPD